MTWQSYTDLATKETELKVSSQITGVEVALASPATAPDQKVGGKTVMTVGIAGALGLTLRLVIA